MEMSRRKLITGLVSFMAAPAIVRASSLMPVKAIAPRLSMHEVMRAMYAITKAQMDAQLYGTGFYIWDGDGSAEHIPASAVIIDRQASRLWRPSSAVG